MKFIIGLILGFILGATLVVYASPYNIEYLFNKVYISASTSFDIRGV